MTTTRETFVDNKLLLLEKRLTAVEKFIELRFKGFTDKWKGLPDDEHEARSSRRRTRTETPKESNNLRSESSKPRKVKKFKGGKKNVDDSEEEAETILKLKECVVRVSREDVEQQRRSTNRGRPKRAPKRFDDEVFPGSALTQPRNPPIQVREVKTEAPDSQNEELQEDEEDPDWNMDEQVDEASAEDEDGCQSDDYFSFTTPEKRKRADDSAASGGSDDSDDLSAGEKDSEVEKPAKKSRRKRQTGGKGSGKKRGKYKKRIKLDEDEVKVVKPRKFLRLDLTEIPQDSIANTDPTMKQCNLCNRHFKEEFFDTHLENHAKERHLTCKECGKSYYNLFILRKHMKTHAPERYMKKCRQCDKPFIHSDKLLHHERYCVRKSLEKNEHVDPELIEDLRKRTKGDTSWIEQAMETGSRLKSTSTESPSGERKLCPHCNKNFKIETFEKHVQSHNKVKNWSCNMCDKAYHYKHDLVRHLSIEHATDQKCELCEKTFGDRPSLKKHLTECRREYREKHRGEKRTSSPIKSKLNAPAKLEIEEEVMITEEISEVTSVNEVVLNSDSALGPGTVIVIEEQVVGDDIDDPSTFETQPIATLELVATDE